MMAVLASGLLVLHLDFNTIQMREDAVVDMLREAAGMGYNAVLWEIENKVRWETCPECVDPEAFSKDDFRRILAEADLRARRIRPAPREVRAMEGVAVEPCLLLRFQTGGSRVPEGDAAGMP